MKRKVLTVLGFIFALVTALAVFAACGGEQDPEKKQSGSEAGTYYCDYEGTENTLTLGGECAFELKIGTTVLTGNYELDGEILTLSPAEAGAISARYKNERISFTYSNVSYTFLRKIEYTVSFDTDGGTEIADVKVVNGRTVARPAAPSKGELIFVGWYTDNTYQNPFYFSQPITGDKTIYARFVAPLNPEFDVKFDLGYTGAPVMPAVRTVGHKLYPDQVAAPERTDGTAFLGWYVSDFETRTELSREFSVETEIAQDFTLYAVWADTAGAPVVSVTESGVEISAEGENLGGYNLKITAPDETVFTHSDALATGATTKYAYDFTEKAEGKYKIEVEVAGVTTTRYLNNKALARVSDFRVELAGETRTLIFNSVAGATEYKITVECGTAGHEAVHTERSLGTTTAYDFSVCAMGADDTIKFTVKAYAAGHVTSVSETYVYDATLDEADDLSFDEATGEVKWSKVDYATSYRVTVSLNNHAVVEDEEVLASTASGDEMRYSVKNIGKGSVSVEVTPVAFGWNSPDASTYNFEKASLAAPANVRLDGETIKWDAVTDATGYEVVIGGTKKTVDAPTTQYELKTEDFGTADEVEIAVYAVGATPAEKSYASDTVSVLNANEIRNLDYAGGYATWQPVFGATEYKYKVGNGDTWTSVTEPKAAITFTAAGEQIIHVKSVKDGTESEEKTKTVTVYTVSFNIGDAANEIDEVPDKYLAAGDPITLPATSWVGYELQGWYEGPDAEDDKYESTVFAGGNLTLFAHFTANTYTITLVAGPQGEWTEKEITVSYRQSNFTLPVPTPNSEEYTFQGWYRGVGGTGARFADTNGGNTGTYTLLKGLTVYAKWTTPFSYKSEQGGYSISASASIGDTKEVTIPVKHNGKDVITVEDFTAGTSLEVIHIPNTVQNISLGSIGAAFEGLKNLKTIDIYEVAGNNTPKYADADGMVYEVATQTLIYVPTAYKTPTGSTEVTLPEGIRSIRAGAIYENTTITKLTIPASVTEVQADAIHGPTKNEDQKLTTIEFQSATEGGSLAITDGAFIKLKELTTIIVPKYVADFSAAKWDADCAKIVNINISGAQPGVDNLFDKDGVLCRTIEDETGATQEIVYYPIARTATTYEIPDGITSIGDSAFAKETSFTSMVIPAQITNIGANAFNGCSKLATLTFNGTATSGDLTVKESAFVSTKLTTLRLPANLIKTEFKAFYTGSSTSAGLENIYLTGRGGESANDESTVKVPDLAMGTFGITSASAKQRVLHIDATYPEINLAEVFAHPGTTATAAPSASKLTQIDIAEGNQNYTKPADGQPGYGGVFNSDTTKILFVFDMIGTTPIKSFTIPDTVTEIGSLVFKSKSSLESITIPASVTTIADYAFQSCSKLASVTFTPFVAPEESPDATRKPLTIGKYAFASCGTNGTLKLESIELPKETVEIGEGAFSGCNKLTSFTVPENVKHIAASVFSSCQVMTQITLPDGLLSIGDSAFNNCKVLESIELKEGLLSIGDSAFTLCNALEKITIPASVETIGVKAFYNCAALSVINVAAQSKHFAAKEGALYETTLRPGTQDTYDETTLLFVAKNATGDNEETKALNIPATVTKVTNEVMSGNASIKAVNFAKEVQVYQEDGTTTLGTLTIGDKAFNGVTQLTTVQLPAGLSELVTNSGSNGVFCNCKLLTTVNIPYTVTSLGAATFYNCEKLVNVTFDEADREEDRVPLVLETSNPSSGAWYGVFNGCTALTDIALPERTTTFGRDTFWNSGLERLSLPSTLKEIPDYALCGRVSGYGGSNTYSLQNLQEITFPERVESGFVIGYCAIRDLPALTTLGYSKEVEIDADTTENVWFLPEGLTALDAGALGYLPQLKSIGFPSTLETVGRPSDTQIISSCTGIETVVFADNCALEEIDGVYFINGMSSLVSGVKHVIFGENMKLRKLGTNEIALVSLFGNAPNLTSITIPASVETIGNYAFMNLANLTEVKFEAGSKLTSIGDNAFQNTGLTEFTFPNVADEEGNTLETTVGANVFSGCSHLTTIKLSTSIWSVTGLFSGLSALETVEADENSQYFSVDNDQKIIFGLNADGDKDTLIYVYDVIEGPVTLPEGTLEVATGAYRGQTGITSLELSSTVIKIGANAFENCASLESVTIDVDEGEASALSLIDDSAFSHCYQLASFDFAKAVNLNRIGSNAFRYTALQTVDLSKSTQLTSNAAGTTVNGIGDYAFANITTLGTTPIDNNAAVQDQVSVAFPRRIGTLGTNVFNGDTALVRIDLSKVGITTIPTGMFNGCTSLEEVKLPAGIRTIGESAFANTKFGALDLAGYAELTTIGQYAFNGSAITSVKLPNALASLGNYAFQNCASLQEADLSDCTALSTLNTSMFNGCSALETVELPATIESIGDSAFLDCTQLSEITLKGELASIGNYAFARTGLTSIDLSETKVESIGTEAFVGCDALSMVILSDTLQAIGKGAFRGTEISEIELPATVTSIDVWAFKDCTNLVSVETTAEEFDVGGYAFSGCTGLATFPFEAIGTILSVNSFRPLGASATVDIPAQNVFENTGFTEVTLPASACISGAFANCTGLTDVTFDTDVTQVGGSMFLNCEELANVTFKATVGEREQPNALALTTISASAFSGCSSLSNITFEGALTNLSSLVGSAFKGTDISSIDLSDSALTSISANVFEGCASLTSVTLPEAVTSIDKYAFSGCTSLTQHSITMDGVTSIGAYAFSKTGFTSFTIDGNITTVGAGAFSDCASLTSVTVEGSDNEYFATGANGEIYQLSKTSDTVSQDIKTLIYYPASADTLSFAADMTDITDGSIAGYTVEADGSKEFTIPDNIKHIQGYAFRGVELDKLIVPDSDNLVGGIENSAFGESLIKEIVFNCGKDAFVYSSPQSMFMNSTALTAVTFPADLTEIGLYWFQGCTSLTTLTIPATVTTINMYAFRNSGITNLTIPDTVTSLKTGAFAEMHQLTDITINAKITNTSGDGTGYTSGSSPRSVFENSTGLTNVTLGGKLTAIPTYWFINLPNLKNITIPATITKIGDNVFQNSGLESVTFAARTSALTLGSRVFSETKITTLTIPGKVDTLPDSMVSGCAELKWVYLEKGVTTIGSSAFGDCPALRFVNIPSTVITLDISSFKGATNVHVYIPSTVGTIRASTNQGWIPTGSNHIYFGTSLYETVMTRGLTWFLGSNFNADVTVDSNYQAAYDGSGLTDEDNFPLKPADADDNGFPTTD